MLGVPFYAHLNGSRCDHDFWGQSFVWCHEMNRPVVGRCYHCLARVFDFWLACNPREDLQKVYLFICTYMLETPLNLAIAAVLQQVKKKSQLLMLYSISSYGDVWEYKTSSSRIRSNSSSEFLMDSLHIFIHVANSFWEFEWVLHIFIQSLNGFFLTFFLPCGACRW